MPTLFQTDTHRVHVGFWTKKITVIDLLSRKKYPVSVALYAKLNSIMTHIELERLTAAEEAFIALYTFDRFCVSACQPNSFAADMFMSAEPTKFIATTLASFEAAT